VEDVKMGDFDWGVLLQGAGKGLMAWDKARLDKENQEREQYFKILQTKIDAKKVENETQRLQLDQGKAVSEYMDANFEGREDITPNEMKASAKFIKDKFGYNAETFFQPIQDDSGVIKGYSYNGKTFTEKLDDDTKSIAIENAKLDKVGKELDNQLKKIQVQNGGFDINNMNEFKAWYKNNPNATDEQIFEFMANKGGREIFFTTDKDGKTVMRIGPKMTNHSSLLNEMEPSTKATLEKDIASTFEQLDSLERIGKGAVLESLTAKGWAKNKLYKVKDWLNMADTNEAQWLQDVSGWWSQVELVFQGIRHEITGAQAAIKELNMLREDMLNKKMTQNQFVGVYNTFLQKAKRALRIKQYLLRNNDFSAAKLDEVFNSVGDPTLTKSAIDGRGAELEQVFISAKTKRGEKYSDEEIQEFVHRQLVTEGYF
jgi:hypothetical protein